jgi:hypothetical protein
MLPADEIRSHIERHIGSIHQVFNDFEGGSSSISVQHVQPTETRPVHTLITLGMSAGAMAVPEGKESPKFLELMVTLPRDWQLGSEQVGKEEWAWPVRLLHTLAGKASSSHSWIGWGDLIPNGDPPEPYAASTRQCVAFVVPSLLVPTEFYELNVPGKSIAFFAVVPLYKEEWQLGLKQGTKTLIERMVDRDVNDVVDPKRKNVARRRWWSGRVG